MPNKNELIIKNSIAFPIDDWKALQNESIPAFGIFNSETQNIKSIVHPRRNNQVFFNLEALNKRALTDKPAKTLKGNWYYGGVIFKHFGHICAESIHRLRHYLSHMSNYEGIIFICYPEISAEKTPFSWHKELPKHFYEIFNWYFGIKVSKIKFITETTEIETLSVFPQENELGVSTNIEYINFLTDFRQKHKLSGRKKRNKNNFFLAREDFLVAGRTLGLDYVIDELLSDDFEIINPEKLTLSHQIELWEQAETIVVEEGSALHLLDLIGTINAHVIILSRRLDHYDFWQKMLTNKCGRISIFDSLQPLRSYRNILDEHQLPSVYDIQDLYAFFLQHDLIKSNLTTLDHEKYKLACNTEFKKLNSLLSKKYNIDIENAEKDFLESFKKINIDPDINNKELIIQVPNAEVFPFKGIMHNNLRFAAGVLGQGCTDKNSIAHHRRGNGIVTVDIEGLEQRKKNSNITHTIQGNWYYFGVLSTHFGHFCSESIHRLRHYRENKEKYDGLIAIRLLTIDGPIPNWVKYFLEDYLGISLSDIIFICEPSQIENLTIFKQEYILGDKTEEPYLNYLTELRASHFPTPKNKTGGKFFLSRKDYLFASRVLGMDYIISHLADDVQVVLPERLSIEDQINMFLNADMLIIEEGSALHLLDVIGFVDTHIVILSRRPDHRSFWKTVIGNKCSKLDIFDEVELVTQNHIVTGRYPAITQLNKTMEFLDSLNLIKKNQASINIQEYYQSCTEDLQKIWNNKGWQSRLEIDFPSVTKEIFLDIFENLFKKLNPTNEVGQAKIQKDIFVHQIYYNQATLNSLDKGFIPLDNLKNERSDWFEFYSIQNYLNSNQLSNHALYGFLSPKFKNKTSLTSNQVFDFIRENPDADVYIFSPWWEHIGLFKNPFIQGEVFHEGLLKATQLFCERFEIELNPYEVVMHSENTVFCNYFVANKIFWDKWKVLANQLFYIAENDDSELAQLLTGKIEHVLREEHLKVFLQERLASIILFCNNFKVAVYPHKEINALHGELFDDLDTLLHCNELKKQYERTKDFSFAHKFNQFQQQLIDSLNTKLSANVQGDIPERLQLYYHRLLENLSNSELQQIKTPPQLIANKSDLVSILICSKNRIGVLERALISIEKQTHKNIEVCIVSNNGSEIKNLVESFHSLNIKLINHQGSKGKSAAANIALETANGKYCMFLNDDDQIFPSHIQQLVSALEKNTTNLVAYSGTKVVNLKKNNEVCVLNYKYDSGLLRKENYIPTHSVLFSSELIAKGCKFDESLELFEDWDFWLQAQEHTNFLNISDISAIYYITDNSVAKQDVDSNKQVKSNLYKVYSKWIKRWKPEDINETFTSIEHLGKARQNQTEIMQEIFKTRLI